MNTDYLITWFAALSAATIFLFMIDKAAARSNDARIPESLLLIFGLAGGWPGGLFAQHVFRHKTRKSSFRLRMGGVALLNCIVVVAAFDFLGAMGS